MYDTYIDDNLFISKSVIYKVWDLHAASKGAKAREPFIICIILL